MNKYETTGEVLKEFYKENPWIDSFNFVQYTYWLAQKISNNKKTWN